MNMITTTRELENFCNTLSCEDHIAVDTEFIREGQYWAKLCLIQIASNNKHALIDPLSKTIDLSPLYSIFSDSRLVKVFHAARQDLEIFYKNTGFLPKPLFDTQISVMALGLGESLSYEGLVKTRLGIQIDKGSRFTNWAQRPLTEKQLSYALSDVTHLSALYPALYQELETKDRLHWIEEETSFLTKESLYFTKPEDAWKRLKIKNYSKPYLSAIIALASWREIEAKEQNLPRGRVIRDDLLYEIANKRPKTIHELSSLRALPKDFLKSSRVQRMLKALQAGLKSPAKEVSEIEKPQPHPHGIKAIMDMLKVLLQIKCEQNSVTPRLIATMTDLEKIALEEDTDLPALKGWRYDLFGRDALELKKGRLSLSLSGSKIRLIKTESK